MKEWLTTFTASWLIFLLLVDKKQLKYILWGGVCAMILQLIIDTGAAKMNLYHVSAGVKLGGGSAFFTLGAVLTMGTLFVQYIPQNRWLKVAHIIATATLFLAFEQLLVSRNIISHTYWGMAASWFTNVLVFVTLTWVADNFNLHKGKTST